MAKSLNEWMDNYGVSHKNSTNILIHKVCVPLIMFSVFGILWGISFVIKGFPLVNISTIFYIVCMGFYLTLGFKVFLVMFLQGFIALTGVYYLDSTGYLLSVSVSVFVLAWIGQFIGHKIEGKKPSFFEDLQFLLIGPIWVLPFFKK